MRITYDYDKKSRSLVTRFFKKKNSNLIAEKDIITAEVLSKTPW